MNAKGFTIIELIIVMVIIGILAVAIILGANLVGNKAIAEAGVLKANLRFTQSKAMSDLPKNSDMSVRMWGLNITSSNYTIFTILQNGVVSSPNPPVSLPGSNSETYILPPGQTITSGTGLIRFNFRGQPVDASGTPLTANVTITVNGAPPVTVTRETGFVP